MTGLLEVGGYLVKDFGQVLSLIHGSRYRRVNPPRSFHSHILNGGTDGFTTRTTAFDGGRDTRHGQGKKTDHTHRGDDRVMKTA